MHTTQAPTPLDAVTELFGTGVKPVTEPHVDVTEAAKAIGIKHPERIRFDYTALQQPPSGPKGWPIAVLLGSVPAGLTFGSTGVDDPYTVHIDLNALHYAKALGMRGVSIEDTVAHEMIHVKQYEDLGDKRFEAVRVQSQAIRDAGQLSSDRAAQQVYESQPLEVEAFKRGPLFSHLVKVSGFDLSDDSLFPMNLNWNKDL